MLVLARKLGQSIVIDGCTEVTIVEVRGDQVRLGITAPKTVSIYRKELLEQIKAENMAAANSADLDQAAEAAGIPKTEGIDFKEEKKKTGTG